VYGDISPLGRDAGAGLWRIRARGAAAGGPFVFPHRTARLNIIVDHQDKPVTREMR